jgi:hypothetical protein
MSETQVHCVGISFRTVEAGLQVDVTEYEVPPVHLSHQDLDALGLRLLRGTAASSVKQQALRGSPSKFEPGPALSDPSWTEPQGLPYRDLFLSPNRDGLDVYVHDYAVSTVVVTWEALARAGILPRSSMPMGVA